MSETSSYSVFRMEFETDISKNSGPEKIASTAENDPSKGPSNQVQTEAGPCFRFTPSPGSSKFYSHLANGFNSN